VSAADFVVTTFAGAKTGKGWRVFMRKAYRYQRALGATSAESKVSVCTSRWDAGLDRSLPPRCERQIGTERYSPFRIQLCPANAEPGSPYCKDHQ